jgi:hypothetical protein
LCIAAEYSVKVSIFLMKQVNIFSLRVLSNIYTKFGITEIMKTSPVFEVNGNVCWLFTNNEVFIYDTVVVNLGNFSLLMLKLE